MDGYTDHVEFFSMDGIPGNPIEKLNAHACKHGLAPFTLHVKEQIPLREDKGIAVMRASASGDAIECPRKLVYDIQGYPQDDPLEGTSLRTFRTGTVEHDMLRHDMMHADVPIWDMEKGGQFEDPEYGLDEIAEGERRGISYHLDLKTRMDLSILGGLQSEVVLLDIKTATKYKLEDCRNLRPDPRAVAQCNFYAAAEQVAWCGLLYQAKEKQWMAGVLWRRDEELVRLVAHQFRHAWRIAHATKDNQAERGFEPSPRSKDLPWQCGYCAYTKACWGHCGITYKGGDPYKPRVAKILPPKELL